MPELLKKEIGSMKKHFLRAILLICVAVLFAMPFKSTAGLNDRFTDLVKLVSNYIEFEGAVKNAYETKLVPAEPTADRTITLPDRTGTVVTTGDTASVTATMISDVVKYFQLPLASFVTEDSASTVAPITASTTPGWEMDDLMPNIVWADGETSPITISFVIPTDYASGGAFKVVATESGTSTPNQIDFDVLINADGVLADSARTNQTPVALAGTSATPDVVTLTVSTDFASLAAGQWVTLRIWRDDTATGTNDLEVKGITFYYTASQ